MEYIIFSIIWLIGVISSYYIMKYLDRDRDRTWDNVTTSFVLSLILWIPIIIISTCIIISDLIKLPKDPPKWL